MPEGRPAWFERDVKPIWDQYLLTNQVWAKLPTKRPLRYVEIGVAAGDSLIWCLENLRLDLAVGIDPYIAPKRRMQPSYDAYKREAAQRLENYAGRVALVYESSDVWLMKQCSLKDHGFYDMLLVDGDHNGIPALTDMVLGWRLLNVGGIMVVDDIHRRWLHGRSKVREAWRAWCDVYEDGYEFVFREPHQAAVRKIR